MAEAELPLQSEVDRLFGLPPEDFVKEREALARRLRSERRRDEAQEVHSLKKPSQACGAINRVARDDPRLAHDVVSVGDALREAQLGLGSGGGSDVLRAAAHAQRQAVDRFTQAARVALAQGGPGSEDMLRRIRDTLLAAATDSALAEQLSAGRVVREQAPVGFGPFAAALGSVDEPPVPVRAQPDKAAAPLEDEARSRAEARARKAADADARRRAQAQARVREARAGEARAHDEVARLEAALDEATTRRDRAREALERGRRELEAASGEAGDLEEAVKLARDGAARASGRLRELERKADG